MKLGFQLEFKGCVQDAREFKGFVESLETGFGSESKSRASGFGATLRKSSDSNFITGVDKGVTIDHRSAYVFF